MTPPATPQPELLPCPFCGHMPTNGCSRDIGYVRCGNTDCPVRPHVERNDSENIGGFTFAREAWNTRVNGHGVVSEEMISSFRAKFSSGYWSAYSEGNSDRIKAGLVAALAARGGGQ